MDRFVRHPHCRLVGVLGVQVPADLRRTPPLFQKFRMFLPQSSVEVDLARSFAVSPVPSKLVRVKRSILTRCGAVLGSR